MVAPGQVPRQRINGTNGTKAGKPPRSWLAAVLCGLIEYLEANTPVSWSELTGDEVQSIQMSKIDWKYYDSRITPNMGAKGGVRLLKTNALDYDREINKINWREKLITVQIRILIADPDPLELECLLCDWEEYIDDQIDHLKFTGITGLWRGVRVSKALMSLQNSPRGNTFASDETPGAQGGGGKQYTGILFSEYIAPFEKDVYRNLSPQFW